MSTDSRLYGHRWRKVRLAHLRSNPLCVECKRLGRITAATVVDHIKPYRGDAALFWDSGNWQSLCKQHHDQKTAREDGGFGGQDSAMAVAGCGADGMPTHPGHPWSGG